MEQPRCACGSPMAGGDTWSGPSGDMFPPHRHKRSCNREASAQMCESNISDETMGVFGCDEATVPATVHRETFAAEVSSSTTSYAGGSRRQQSFHPFTSSFSGHTHSNPDMDVIRKADHYEVQLDLPGHRAEEVTLHLRNRVLYVTVSPACPGGQRPAFSTTVQLPHDVDPQRVSADMARGLLRLRLPRGATDGANQPDYLGGTFSTTSRYQTPLHIEHLHW
eukprot:jgi/Tetstr1/446758/TSEL_034245.t1